MDSNADDVYDEREQTLVKHEILRNYLLPFALIIGQHQASITYVDCFSGPWKSRTSDYSDTSFGIAIEQLRAARAQVAGMGKTAPRLRAFFIEQNREAYAELELYLSNITDIEIEHRNDSFGNCINDIKRFVAADRKTFPFFLIDPKGWTIPLNTIRPLLVEAPGESLIMFMTEHIRRFINHRQQSVRDGFDAMYGETNVGSKFSLLTGHERDHSLLSEYQNRVQQAGHYEYCSAATVLNPRKNRTHFNLVYLTRHHRGIEKFKDSERRAMKTMEETRANIEQESREKLGQGSLFPLSEVGESSYYINLRNASLRRLNQAIDECLSEVDPVPYDSIWDAAMRLPLVWPTDVSDRIVELFKSGQVEIIGLRPREKVPKKGSDHRIQKRS